MTWANGFKWHTILYLVTFYVFRPLANIYTLVESVKTYSIVTIFHCAYSFVLLWYIILFSLNLSTLLPLWWIEKYGSDQRRIQGGRLWGLSPPPWTSEIYGFQESFRPQRVLSPPCKEKKFKPLPWTNIFLNTPLGRTTSRRRFLNTLFDSSFGSRVLDELYTLSIILSSFMFLFILRTLVRPYID